VAEAGTGPPGQPDASVRRAAPAGSCTVVPAAAQGYETKDSAHKGIESVKTSASAAKVVDLTEREPAHN
jgi:Domain of unknown function (DUF1508)